MGPGSSPLRVKSGACVFGDLELSKTLCCDETFATSCDRCADDHYKILEPESVFGFQCSPCPSLEFIWASFTAVVALAAMAGLLVLKCSSKTMLLLLFITAQFVQFSFIAFQLNGR